MAIGELMVSACKSKIEFVERLRGGVIMDVTTPEQARIAEDAGAVAVMALERALGYRAQGGGENGRSRADRAQWPGFIQ